MTLKRYLILCLIMFSLVMIGRGQVVIIPEVQSGGLVLRQQIFSMMVNNLTGSPKAGQLVIQVMDRSNSQILLEATSNQTQFPTGAKRFTYSDLSPFLISQSAPEFSLDKSFNLPVPIGDYLICYKLYNADNKREILASECVKISTESLSPPQLVQPDNESTIMDTKPVFAWTPPSPVNMFTSLSYDILVTPKFKDQSAEEAIQRNLPVLFTGSLKNNLPYPASFNSLESGKEYAWQIIAKDGNRYSGKSEAWSFTIIPDSVKMIIESAAFVRIQESKSEVSFLQQGILKIDYVNNLSDSLVKVVITDMTELGNHPIDFDLTLTPGQNMIKKDINRLGRLQQDHVYKLTIINSRKEAVFFRFIPKYHY